MPLFKSENTQNIPFIPTFHDTFALIFQSFEPCFIPTFFTGGQLKAWLGLVIAEILHEVLEFYLSVGCCIWNTSMSAVGVCSTNLAFTCNVYHSQGLFSRWQTDDISLSFLRKQVFTFHANCLPWRQFEWNLKACFMGKIRKNISICHLLKNLPFVLSINSVSSNRKGAKKKDCSTVDLQALAVALDLQALAKY